MAPNLLFQIHNHSLLNHFSSKNFPIFLHEYSSKNRLFALKEIIYYNSN